MIDSIDWMVVSVMKDTAEKHEAELQELKRKHALEVEAAYDCAGRFRRRLLKAKSELQKYKLKAARWDAFMSQGRIRILGWAKLGEIGYQHMGFEIWTQYGKPGEYDFTKENAEAVQHIETYMDAWLKTQEINKLEGK
jgi:hypothetical protein